VDLEVLVGVRLELLAGYEQLCLLWFGFSFVDYFWILFL
jgi:hypothetical protein